MNPTKGFRGKPPYPKQRSDLPVVQMYPHRSSTDFPWRSTGAGVEFAELMVYLEDHPMTCKWLITMVIVFVP